MNVDPPTSHIVGLLAVMAAVGYVLGATLGDASPAALLTAISAVAVLSGLIFFRLER